MNDAIEQLEGRLELAGRTFVYPPTPDFVAPTSVRRQRPAPKLWLMRAALVLLALLVGAAAIPPVRAAVIAFLRIGAVEISPQLAPPLVPTAATTATTTMDEPAELRGFVGATTLAAAQRAAGYPIRLPHYPAELGPPDNVYLQDLGGPVVVLAWRDPAASAHVLFALHQLPPNTFAQKFQPEVIEQALVHGQAAIWTQGPYPILFRDAAGQEMIQTRRLVAQHALIWAEGDMTYRIETALPLEEAIKIAESLDANTP